MRPALHAQETLSATRLARQTLAQSLVFWLITGITAALLTGRLPAQAPPDRQSAVKTPAISLAPDPSTSPAYHSIRLPAAILQSDPLARIAQLRQPPVPISFDFTIDSFTTDSLPGLRSGPVKFPEHTRFHVDGSVRIQGNLIDIRKRESSWSGGQRLQGNAIQQLFDGKTFWNIQQPLTAGQWCPVFIFNRDTPLEENAKAIADCGGFLAGRFPFFPSNDWLVAALKSPNVAIGDQEELIGNFPCLKIRFQTDRIFSTFWVDMNRSGLPRQIEIVLPEPPPPKLRNLLKFYKPGEIELKALEIRDVDIQKIGDREMPVAGTFVTRTHFRNGERAIQVQRFRRTSIVLKPAQMGQFAIGLPAGTVVDDARYLLKYEWDGHELRPFLDPNVASRISDSVRQIIREAQAARPALLQGFKLASLAAASTMTLAASARPGLDPYCHEALGPRAGIYCIYAALKLAGLDANPENLFRSEYIDGKGSSLAQLETLARKHGLHADAADRLPPRALSASPYPLVLRVKGKPYSKDYDTWELFLGRREGQAWMWNPASLPRLESMASLAARWNGTGLVLSRAPVDWFRLKRMDGLVALLTLGVSAAVLWQVRRFARNRGSALPVLKTTIYLRRCLIEGIALAMLATVLGLLWHGLSGRGLLRGNGAAHVRLSRAGMFLHSVDISQVRSIAEGREEATLIDARDPAAFFQDHIPQAKNVFLGANDEAFRAAIEGIPRDGRLVIYCASEMCHMAENLAARMTAEGFGRIEIYQGGIAEWLESKQKTNKP